MKSSPTHPFFKIAERKWLVHAIFWTIYLGPTSYYLLTVCHWHDGLIPVAVTVAITLMAAYFNLYFLIPRFLLYEKYTKYFLYLLALLIVFCAVYTLWYLFFLEHYFKVVDHESYVKAYVGNLFESAIVLVVTTAFKLSKDWFKQQNRNKELLTEKLKSEVQFLRSQINSHFLFNTLNNLYGLALSKSDKTPEAIIKLSEMMEYMLYESDKDRVLLEREVTYIKSYVEIEKLRHPDFGNLDLKIIGLEGDHYVAPFIMVPLVENAFKHSDFGENENNFIRIKLVQKASQLELTVENSKAKADVKNPNVNGGVGIKNVKQRLELLYPEKHHLNIQDLNATYQVHLKLDLS